MAQVSSPLIAIPSRELNRPYNLYSPAVAAWLPMAIILAGIVSLFYLAQTSEMASTGYNIQELQAEESDSKLRNEQLALDVSRARSLASVESQAVTRLLMVPAKQVVYLRAADAAASTRLAAAASGETLGARALEKPAAGSSGDLLDSVRFAISSVLAPGSQPPARQH